MSSPRAASCITADQPALLGRIASLYRSCQDRLGCRALATSTSQRQYTTRTRRGQLNSRASADLTVWPSALARPRPRVSSCLGGISGMGEKKRRAAQESLGLTGRVWGASGIRAQKEKSMIGQKRILGRCSSISRFSRRKSPKQRPLENPLHRRSCRRKGGDSPFPPCRLTLPLSYRVLGPRSRNRRASPGVGLRRALRRG